MQSTHIIRETTVNKTFRVSQISSMFDVPLQEKTRHEWDVHLPLDEKSWQIGLIVGPSGCGKSTIARELWPNNYIRGYCWDEQSILDNFPKSMESKQVVQALTSVGFSSPPDWVKPYSVLSTGQQMRSDLAQALCADELVVFDEFTSVVDRIVAKVGSAALAKAIRKRPGRQFIAVTCHEDVLEWLTPDWTYEPHTNSFQWRCLRRPPITLEISRVHTKAWAIFGKHHYMNANLHSAAQCFMAEWNGVPVGIIAALPMIGFKDAWRATRLVVLPDYQGVGIGIQLADFVAEHFKQQGKRFRRTFSHPAVVYHCNKSPKWKLVTIMKTGSVPHAGKKKQGDNPAHSSGRCVVTFEYVGDAR